jgi:hypothetical protein
MKSSILPSQPQYEEDQAIWSSLKNAIALSSGFQRWLTEKNLDTSQSSLDEQVRQYLQETLATLAY